MLTGRATETARIGALIDAARAGRSGALVIRGDAGIGKSALLDDAVGAATGMRVLRSVGVEAEAEFPFGGLHQLLAPFVDRIDVLPASQASALRAAFGLVDGTDGETSRFQVAAATLSLVAELAEETPVLCVIDDAQWLDRGSSDAVLFAARRFHADAVAVLIAVRDTAIPYPTPGLDTLHLTELSGAAAAQLLHSRSPELAPGVRDRVLDEAGGNPLAIIELGAAQHGSAHPSGPVGPLPASGRVQQAFRAQIGGLDPSTRTALLVAAADGSADLDLVLAVGARLGVSVVDMAPAERAHLISVNGAGVTFRHPLVRAAAYQVPEHHQRLAVHAAFAAELTGPADPDRRAWHLAAAVTGTDEAVAIELDRTAERALRRGDVMTVSAACDRAARLSTDDSARAARLTRAAQAAWDAGRLDRAARLAHEAVSYGPEPVLTAEAMFVRAQLEYDRTSPAADAQLALSAARLALADAPERAVHMLTEVTLVARHTADAEMLREAAALLRTIALPSDTPVRLVVDALLGWSDLLGGGPEVDAEALRVLVRSAVGGEQPRHDWIVAGISAILLGDDADATTVMSAMVAETRDSGALGWLPYVLEFRAMLHMLRGELVDARSCLAEGIALGTELGTTTEVATLRAMSVWVDAVSGESTVVAADSAPAEALGLVSGTIGRWGLALADLAAGHLAAALPVLDEVCSGAAARDVLVRAIPDHVEAAVRSGDPAAARRHLPILERWAAHAGPSAAGLVLRCHALLGDDVDDVDRLFQAAIEAHETAGGCYDLARTRLVHGEWLRRRRRRTDARVQLEAATAAFDRMGARQWASRARAEGAAAGAGGGARPDAPDPLRRLTPQEVQVVRMAGAGLSNKEIGAQLYLSPRTVGHHLYRSFQKLGVSNRTELARLAL